MNQQRQRVIHQVRECPVCDWHGATHMCDHIINAKDESHREWLDLLVRRYHSDLSPKLMADIRDYRDHNITWVMIRDMLSTLGELNRRDNVEHTCPCCSWTGTQRYNNHLNEMIASRDNSHIQLKQSIVDMRNRGLGVADISRNVNIAPTIIRVMLQKEGLSKKSEISIRAENG